MICAECGAEVSPLREFCPKCGTPTDPGLRERRRTAIGPEPDEQLKKNRKTVLIIAAIVVGLGVTGKVAWHAPSVHVDREDREERERARGPVEITADDLFKAYRDNESAAEKRFEGREMTVTGEFLRIVPDGYNSLDLRLKTSDPDQQVGVDVAGIAIDDAKKLIPGQTVTVSCQGMGSGADILWVRDCAIQSVAKEGPATPATASSPPAPPAPPADEGNKG